MTWDDIPVDAHRLLDIIAADDMIGFCLECGDEVQPLEPDARNVECSRCGEHKVCGAEMILLMVQP